MADAISKDNMPGYRAGNQVIDAFYRDIRETIKKISPLIDIKKKYAIEEAKILLKRKSRDKKRIECALDELLEVVEDRKAEEEFQNLNHYYFKINKQGALDYNKFYKKIKRENSQ